MQDVWAAVVIRIRTNKKNNFTQAHKTHTVYDTFILTRCTL